MSLKLTLQVGSTIVFNDRLYTVQEIKALDAQVVGLILLDNTALQQNGDMVTIMANVAVTPDVGWYWLASKRVGETHELLEYDAILLSQDLAGDNPVSHWRWITKAPASELTQWAGAVSEQLAPHSL